MTPVTDPTLLQALESEPSQMTGALRYPAMAASEALSGFETIPALGAQGINYLTSHFGPAGFPQIPNVQDWTNRLGLTNNPSLVPGLGPYPEAERLGAAAMRGIGGAAPALAMGAPAALALGLGAAGGAAGEATTEATGSPLAGAAAGVGVGLLGGGVASMFRPTAPGVPAQLTNVKGLIGAPDADIYTAGNQLQGDLARQQWLSGGGFGPASSLSQSTITSLMKAKPMQAANQVLKDPDALATLRAELPDTVDQLAGGMIWQNPMQWNRLPQKARDALLPDEAHQEALESALAAKKPTGGSGGIAEPLIATLLGGAGGAAASHLLHLPFGEYLGGELGSMAGLAVNSFKNRAIAAAIVNPWVRASGIAGGLGGAAGSQQSPLAPRVPEGPTNNQ
jgi:hypothetical protein